MVLVASCRHYTTQVVGVNTTHVVFAQFFQHFSTFVVTPYPSYTYLRIAFSFATASSAFALGCARFCSASFASVSCCRCCSTFCFSASISAVVLGGGPVM